MFDFWRVQSEKLLFPEIEWNRPEQKNHAGKILIVGGQATQFRALALAYETALKTGAGEVRILAPDSLRKVLKIEKSTDITYAPSNKSGGFSSLAFSFLTAGEEWADSILFIGDTNQNSETAILFERFILQSEKPIFIARDAADILLNSSAQILEKENITLLASFAQLQKIFSTVFYPKILTFSMNLANLAETIHKFTLTYPSEIITFHAENLVIAKNGEVFSNPANAPISRGKISPIRLWSGETAARLAVWQIWNPSQPAQAAITGAVSD
ncbi:MAG: hypothetical protein Q4A27_00450 [bacterium]|nr:hypothetical protein [bacterium]